MSLSDLEFTFRLDTEYYQKEYLRYDQLIESKEYQRLEDVSDFLIGPFGSAFNTENYEISESASYRYVRGRDIKPFVLMSDDNRYLPKADFERLEKYSLKEDDILVSVVGTLGNASIVMANNLPAIFSNKSSVLRNITVNPYYLLTYLNSRHGRNLSLRMTRGAIQTGLNLDDLKSLNVPVFSIEFQLQIESVVKQAHQTQEHGKALYQEAEALLLAELGLDKEDKKVGVQSQELTLADSFLASGRIDAEFYAPQPLRLLSQLRQRPYVTLGSISTIRNGFPWSSDAFQENGVPGEPVVRIRDCKPFYIENKHLTTIESGYASIIPFEKAQPNDIVIGMDGLKWFYGSLITEPVFVNQRVCHLTIRAKTMPPEYVTLVINSRIGQTQLLREMTIAQTVGHITNQSVSGLLIPQLPDIKMEELAQLLRESMAAKSQSEQLLSTAKRAVELAIETSEETAVAWLNEQSNL